MILKFKKKILFINWVLYKNNVIFYINWFSKKKAFKIFFVGIKTSNKNKYKKNWMWREKNDKMRGEKKLQK